MQTRKEKAQVLFERLFDAYSERIGEWRKDPELQGTPRRLAEMWEEMTSGYDESKNGWTVFPTTYSGIVAKAGIPITSLCGHHGLPWTGEVLMAYIPRKVKPLKLGLSKMPRLVRHYAARLTSQEELTDLLADKLQEATQARGCMVGVRANHTCESVRGVRVSSVTCTQSLRGEFLTDADLKDECYNLTG